MLFIERPILVAHVRDFCARFNEGLRVEYKRDFDPSVREKLPKIVCSFANSHGGVLILGVRTVNGVPEAPFEGFEPQPREELPLTVENICLKNIYPPVLPRTSVVQSDVNDRIFLVIEVEESGEAPHAIENSTKVYVSTGNAANPYDLADVELILELVKRRKEPAELRDRLHAFAASRADKWVHGPLSYAEVTICPRFPRSALCPSDGVYKFTQDTRYRNASIIDPNYVFRVPDGVAGRTPNRATTSAIYEEINRYGLLFVRTQFREMPWQGDDSQPVLIYGDLFHMLCKVLCCAHAFYSMTGFKGSVLSRVSLHNVDEKRMTFYRLGAVIAETAAADDFRCIADVVSAERLVDTELIATNKLDVLTDILREICWSFWQSLEPFPRDRLTEYAAEIFHTIGLV